MKTKEKIIDILMTEFSNVYCHNCEYNNNGYDNCEECHRKYMNWSLSGKTAERIADEILKD